MTNPILRKIAFCAISVFAGWVAAFAMPPASLWPCMFAGLSALYWLFGKTETAGQAFGAGFFFALGYFVTGLWWIGNALLVEGNDFAWVWPISVIGLPTLLALFTGTYLGIARIAFPPQSFKGFLAFVLMLTLSEWTRGNAFTGFPWNLYGYVWADHLPMAQAAHYAGAYGLTFVTILWAAAPGYLLICNKDIRPKIALGSVGLATLAATFFLGQMRLATSKTEYDKTTGILVVQPNIPQNMKWDPVAVQENFLKISSLSKNATFNDPQPSNIFIVWPETAISPAIYSKSDNIDRIRKILKGYTQSDAYLVTGVLRRMGDGADVRFANSVVLLNKDTTAIQTYDKTHLVPFGEFIPFQDIIPLKPVVAFRGFERGKGATTISREGVPSFSPLICYEVIFPDRVVASKGLRPAWIVNVTNDGWYGDSAGPYQHFAQTRLRAIEEGLPVIRSANTGISGIIDPYGRTLERADIFQEATLSSYLPRPLTTSHTQLLWVIQVILCVSGFFFITSLLFKR